LRKIKWRVRNNVFFAQDLASAGFTGRLQFESPFTRLKKFLYIPYAFLLFPTICDALALIWSRRDPAYWKHVPLTLYTAGLIAFMMLQRTLGYRPVRKSYGEEKVIHAGPGSSH